MLLVRLALVLVVLLGANGLLATASGPVAAQVVGAEAYGLAIGEPSQPVAGTPYVALPTTGGFQSDFSAGTGVGIGGGVGNVDAIRVTANGDEPGTVTSSSEVGVVELLDGLVRATNVEVSVRSTVGGGGASSTGVVRFGSLTVAGLSYPDPRPNERIELPGVGYVVLNEQLVGGDGQTTTSIIVRALRLQVTEQPILLDVRRGTEFVVASASTGVPGISASTPVPSGPLPTATPVPWRPISTVEPVDISIPDRNRNGNDDFGFDNDNAGNDNGGRAPTQPAGGQGGGGAQPAGTQRPVVVTVVVVVTTPTPSPTPTRPPGR